MKKFFAEIPGHVRAYTWMEATVAIIVGYLASGGRWGAVLGMLLAVVGSFVANQATHLERENHKGMDRTELEEALEAMPKIGRLFGLAFYAAGVAIALGRL